MSILPRSSPNQMVPMETIIKTSIVTNAHTEINVVDGEAMTWMTPINDFSCMRDLPGKLTEASKIKDSYCLHNGWLYRKGKGIPDLKCVLAIEAPVILQEFHNGVYR